MKLESYPGLERSTAEKKEDGPTVAESLDSWLYAQGNAKAVYGELGKSSNRPQERYQELQTNLEAHQSEALKALDNLAKHRGEALAAIAERRAGLGQMYEKGVRQGAQVETAAGQKIFKDKLDLLDQLEEKLRSLG